MAVVSVESELRRIFFQYFIVLGVGGWGQGVGQGGRGGVRREGGGEEGEGGGGGLSE